jgi:hypothetical protein
MEYCSQHGVLTTKIDYLIKSADSQDKKLEQIRSELFQLRDEVLVLKTEASSTARTWSASIGLITLLISFFGRNLFNF